MYGGEPASTHHRYLVRSESQARRDGPGQLCRAGGDDRPRGPDHRCRQAPGGLGIKIKRGDVVAALNEATRDARTAATWRGTLTVPLHQKSRLAGGFFYELPSDRRAIIPRIVGPKPDLVHLTRSRGSILEPLHIEVLSLFADSMMRSRLP